jgi:hypothetical protein
VEAQVSQAYGPPRPVTGLVELAYSAQDTLLMSIFPDAYSFLPYVIWKSDQIQGSLQAARHSSLSLKPFS